MVLVNDYGKVILEVNENEIIYKKLFKKYIIKKCDIRSLYYDEFTLVILCYDGKIYSLNITSLLFSERKKLEELYEKLNKENILFNFNSGYRTNNALWILWVFIPLSRKSYIALIETLILILIIYIMIKERRNSLGTLYNLDKKEFEVLKNNKVIKIKREDVDDIKINNSNGINILEITHENNKYKIYVGENIDFKKLYNKQNPLISMNH